MISASGTAAENFPEEELAEAEIDPEVANLPVQKDNPNQGEQTVLRTWLRQKKN